MSITVLSLVLTLLWGAEALSQAWKTYYTKDNPNAQNVSLSVDYPSEFQLGVESINSIIAHFRYYDNNSDVMKILQISIIGDTSLITDRLIREPFENNDEYDFCFLPDSEIKRILAWPQRDPGLTFKPNGRKKLINGVCGIQASGSIELSEQGIQLFTELDGFIFGYLNKSVRAPRYVILSCNTTGLMIDKNIIQAVHQKDSPTLCNKYFDSVKLYDK